MNEVNGLAVSPTRVPKTAELVSASLRRQIVRGEIAEGARLPSEADMMASYGVSRPSLREALRILESEGLITVRRGAGGGARATRPTIAVAANYIGTLMQFRGITLVDVFDARLWIEPLAARILAERRGRAAAIRTLREVLSTERDQAHDYERYAAATTQFHRQLVELSGNGTLALLWSTLQHVLSVEVLDLHHGFHTSPRSIDVRQAQCSELLDLIADGAGDVVEQYWRTQLTRVRKTVIDAHGVKTVVDTLG